MIYADMKRASVHPEDYVRDLLVYQCMPTLLKLKPASLIIIDKSLAPDIQVIYSLLQRYLDQYNCSFITFQETDSRLYLFIYCEHLLRQAITTGMRQSFLESYGYPVRLEPLAASLSLLGIRYRNYWTSGSFPHEIGIFLGYPLADVEGFIRNHGRDYIFCGMWKVYQRVTVAESAFQCFHQLKARAIGLTETKRQLFHLCKEELQVYRQIVWELLSY